MGMLRKTSMWKALFLSCLATTHAYHSRPDLTPPKLNITTTTSHLSSGYLFISPYSASHSLQSGNYILDSNGELIYSGASHWDGWNGNFQAAEYSGKSVIYSYEGDFVVPQGHGFGHHRLLDQKYETVANVTAGGGYEADFHEFSITDEGTAVLGIWEPVKRDLTAYGGEKGGWVAEAIIQEIDIESGKLLFEWHSLDHVPLDESVLSLPSNNAGDASTPQNAWDYFHLNSIQKGPDGHYLLSARSTSTIYKINGTSGSVIWRLSSRSDDFHLGSGVEFGFQHHARYLSSNETHTVISLFDNSWFGSGPDDGIHPYSRGKYIALDHVNKRATLVQEFIPPTKITAKSQGNLQTLPNGNVLINWGSEGQITEYAPNGTILFHAHLGEDVQNYRAFKYHWAGISPETPALTLERHNGNFLRPWVSWNGDTRVVTWSFHLSQSDGVSGSWGLANRVGFETPMEFLIQEGWEGDLYVYAEGLDLQGQVIGRTETVTYEVKAEGHGETESHSAQKPLN